MIARRTRSAFTFVEILAALAFLGILMPIVISAILTSNRAGVIAGRSAIAAELAQNKMAELLIDDAWATSETAGTFDNMPGYQWELSQQDWQSGSMTELIVTVTFQVQGTAQHVALSTLVTASASTQ